MEKDYLKTVKQIVHDVINYYDYDDPSYLGFQIEHNISEEVKEQVVSRWDAYEIIESAELESWADVEEDYGYDLTSVYGLASWLLTMKCADYYYEIVREIMKANGWTEETEDIYY